ncbi:unnamed protein product, partial [Mesorhabditis spiculigera]
MPPVVRTSPQKTASTRRNEHKRIDKVRRERVLLNDTLNRVHNTQQTRTESLVIRDAIHTLRAQRQEAEMIRQHREYLQGKLARYTLKYGPHPLMSKTGFSAPNVLNGTRPGLPQQPPAANPSWKLSEKDPAWVVFPSYAMANRSFTADRYIPQTPESSASTDKEPSRASTPGFAEKHPMLCGLLASPTPWYAGPEPSTHDAKEDVLDEATFMKAIKLVEERITSTEQFNNGTFTSSAKSKVPDQPSRALEDSWLDRACASVAKGEVEFDDGVFDFFDDDEPNGSKSPSDLKVPT